MVTSACNEQAQMDRQALPAARGCAVGRPRCRAAAHPPLRPPTLAYSPICPPGSSRLLEPPEVVVVTAREDYRGEDGLPTVGAAHVVELADLSASETSPRRAPVAGARRWIILVMSCVALARGSSALPVASDAVCASKQPCRMCGSIRVCVSECLLGSPSE